MSGTDLRLSRDPLACSVVLDISLDLYFCRIIAPAYKRFMKLNTDFVGLIGPQPTLSLKPT